MATKGRIKTKIPADKPKAKPATPLIGIKDLAMKKEGLCYTARTEVYFTLNMLKLPHLHARITKMPPTTHYNRG